MAWKLNFPSKIYRSLFPRFFFTKTPPFLKKKLKYRGRLSWVELIYIKHIKVTMNKDIVPNGTMPVCTKMRAVFDLCMFIRRRLEARACIKRLPIVRIFQVCIDSVHETL